MWEKNDSYSTSTATFAFERRMGYYQVLEVFKGQVRCHHPVQWEDLLITFTPVDFPNALISLLKKWERALSDPAPRSHSAYVRINSKPSCDPPERVLFSAAVSVSASEKAEMEKAVSKYSPLFLPNMSCIMPAPTRQDDGADSASDLWLV